MLKIVCAAEEESRLAVMLVGQRAQDMVAQSHKDGEDSIASTISRADQEVEHLMRISDQKATADAKELASSIANKIATQRARAERRLDEAVDYIVERIVNS